MSELSLFGEEFNTGGAKRTPKGGSGNPIVFHDYESYIAKFRKQAKTTDDTYTPPDVYEAVVKYVGTIYDLTDKVILRPFYPGGDYRNAEYPEDGVVIDNPPFSIFTEICKFYSANNIPFFLFGPGLTIGSTWKYCGTVIISDSITFENGAVVRCNFATNLVPDMIAMTAPNLGAAISACKSQNIKKNLPKYKYPDNVLSTSDLQIIARGGTPFTVKRSETQIIRGLDCHPKKGGLFGNHLLLSRDKAKEKEKTKEIAKEKAKERAKEKEKEREKEKSTSAIKIGLSPREKRIIERLDSTE
jgi:hypothetical protein